MRNFTTFMVVAEFEKENAEGWVSFAKNYPNRKAATDCIEELIKDPLLLKAELRIVTRFER